MKSHILFNKKFPVILVNRIALFFFLVCFLAVFLYIIGTVQGFMDDTQFILLELIVIMGILLTASSLFGMILELIFFIRNKKLYYLVGIFLHSFLWILGGSIAITASFFIITSKGNVY